MADEGDQRQPGGAEPGGGNARQALEDRVARLEMELAALQRQVAVQAGAPHTTARPAAEAWVAAPLPPTPPPPMPSRPASAATGGEHFASDAWGARPVPLAAAQAADSRESFESRLGSQIFNRIAIVLLLIGTAYFLKLAIDRQWIGPTGRVLAGLLAGAGLVLWSERFRRKGFAAFSYSLKALGTGVLYLSLWAAFQLFHLMPAAMALALMLLVTAWNAYMAWVQDSEVLAAYALAGGFATPLLLSTGGNHETFLFTYLLAIDVATVGLVRLRAWPRLLLGAFPLTLIYFVGWYVENYEASQLALTSMFIALFAAAFGSVPLGNWARGAGHDRPAGARRVPELTGLEDIFLPLANAAFAALAGYSVLQNSGDQAWLPWLMVVLAAVYLGVMQMPQTATASAMHLSLAVVLLTIAIPLKASGHWITVSWLVEGLALLWVATRLGTEQADDAGSAHSARVLRPLALGSLVLGFCGIFVHSIGLAESIDVPLLNKGTGTALTGVAVFALAAWLALRAAGLPPAGASDERASAWGSMASSAFIMIDLTAALLTARELLLSWRWSGAHAPFQSADFMTALIGLAVFAGVIAASLRVAGARPAEGFWMSCAALSTIAFNLIAVLTGVREIEAIWEGSGVGAGPGTSADAALQQALAISAYLMIYGAALLAVGFWRRSGFLRWQGLGLLVLTIFKAFLYDMRSLSQGYRVVSFMGLGALLMAISFAYQKDWLGLRETETGRGAGSGAEQAPGAASRPQSGGAAR